MAETIRNHLEEDMESAETELISIAEARRRAQRILESNATITNKERELLEADLQAAEVALGAASNEHNRSQRAAERADRTAENIELRSLN